MSTEISTSSDQTNNNRRIIWILLLFGILIILVWLGLKAWKTYDATTSLLASQSKLETLMEDGGKELDSAAAESLLLDVRKDIVTLVEEWQFLMPIMPYFEWVPNIGPLLAKSPQLLEMANKGTEAAIYAYRGLSPGIPLLLDDEASATSNMPQILEIVDHAKPDIARASLAIDDVVKARNEIGPTETLPWRVKTIIDQIDKYLPLGSDGLKLALVMPELLGYEQPQRYILIAQNEDELRATGGFISGAGLIVVDKGQITQLDFKDANSVDAWSESFNREAQLTKPYDHPPQAMTDFMLLDLFLFRDANYWPDYPLSAEQAMALYSYGQDIPPLDGAIGVDQQFMELLLSATGPIKSPESGEVINNKNVLKSLQEAWTLQDGVRNRKAFLSIFATAIYDHIVNNTSQIDPVNFANVMGQALNEKHLQIYVQDPDSAVMLADAGWDGRLLPPVNHDALLVADMNVGYNKANYFIDRDLSYQIEIAEDGSGLVNLSISHIHTSPDTGEPCWQGTLQEYSDGAPYIELTNKCYWNYQRVYVPEGSELIEGPQHTVPADTWFGGYDWDKPTEVIQEIPGFTTFTNFMLVPRATQVRSDYRYYVPKSVTINDGDVKHYNLRLFRQAGAPKHRAQIAVTLPDGSDVISTSPDIIAREDNTIFFIVDEFKSDLWISVTYK